MNPAELTRYLAAGCELTKPIGIFVGIYAISGGNPCQGCGYDSHGNKCAAKKLLFTTPKQASECERLRAALEEIVASERRRLFETCPDCDKHCTKPEGCYYANARPTGATYHALKALKGE